MAKPKQRHEKVVSNILMKIYTGELAAGSKMPTEKQLCEDTGVDRTSLRVALKQLESMHLLEIRQGDGIYIKDFMQHAGMDFLRALMLIQEDESRPIIDQYIFDELMEFWILLLPEVVKLAVRKASPRDYKALANMVARERELVGDVDQVVEIELEAQDLIARITKNIVIILLFNSSRPVRKKMLEIVVAAISMNEREIYLEKKAQIISNFAANRSGRLDTILEEFNNMIAVYREKILQSLVSREDFPLKH